ncbi:MAG: TonB-dependent receptor [Hyphomonadaceae bacterium]|nr:TonB-dependent receptor [Hyphomonadaceae bacterium]
MNTKHLNLSQYLLNGAATGLALAVIFGSPAIAQETDAPEVTQAADEDEAILRTVTVTGIRSSIQNSLATKRNATSIVEAISAEDIGKLPDLSIADSLARLPGVTAQRVRGRSQQISIRGLGPDFSLALLNGREVVSSGNNRGVEFDQFPSELIAQGVVYKTPDATLAATGIAGSVDLRTVRPLDYTDRRINLSGKYVLNDNGALNPDFDEDGYRLFGSYIDQNAEGTIGWSLGVTVQSNPTHFFSRELKTNSGQVSIDPATGLVYPADNPRTGVVSREFKRTSVAGSLQFEPTDRWQTSIDGFYTDTEDAGIFRGVETPLASWSNSDPQLTGITGDTGFADSATFSNVNPILRTDTEGNTAEIWALGINTSYEVSDRLTIMGDLSRSELDRSDVDYESYAGTGFSGMGPYDTMTFTLPGSGEYSIDHDLDYTDPSVMLLTDPGGWGQVGFVREPDIEDELTQLRLQAEYDLDVPFISGLTGGVLITDREKSFTDNAYFVRAGAGFVDGSLMIPADSIIGVTDSGSIGFDIIAYDPSGLRNDGTYVLEETSATAWVVDEDINTWYAMAGIDYSLGQVPVTGNVGFQYVDVTQASTGTLAGSGEQTVEYSYEDVLPSLNLSFEVADSTFLRFAAAKTVTRPRLDQLAANQSFERNPVVCGDSNADGVPDGVAGQNPPAQTCYTLKGGNPFLEPYRSTSFDAAVEKYFGDASAVSFAVFHKDLEDWVIDRVVVVDATQQYGAIGLSDFLAANPEIAATRLEGPVNFADGSISGYEATLRLSLDDVLPGTLEGLGFGASYTYADNGLEDENGNEISIPGYSDTVWSGDVYYENFGFRGKLSARYRSGFLSEVQQFNGMLDNAQAVEETIIDAQIGYEWESGPLEGFSVNLEIFNLTDEPFATENDIFNANGDGVGTFVSRHELYGTTYNFTVAKRF